MRGKGKGSEGKGRRERSPPPLSKFLDPPLLARHRSIVDRRRNTSIQDRGHS